MTLEETIRSLTVAGKSQREICETLKLGRGAVQYARKKMHLTGDRPGMKGPTLTEAQETEVLALLKSGRGTSWIGKRLGIGEHQVRLIVKKFNFRRKRGEHGFRYHLSPTKREKILEDIRTHRDFARNIAWKHHVAYKIVLALARQELGCERFRCGYGQPALSSDFPQRHHAKQ